MKLAVLYEDDDFVAVEKPSGLAVHRSDFCTDSITVVSLLGARANPVHRLDRATSGVLLLAKTTDAAKTIGELFTNGAVRKTYLAVVRGYAETEGVIDSPLRADDERDGVLQEARTRYRRLATCELPIPVARFSTARFSLVEVCPETGRMHQIRRHFAHIRHPLVGDTRHGDGAQNRLFRTHFGVHRLVLMATELAFVHPRTGLEVVIHCPPCRALWKVIQGLPWEPGLPG